MEGLASKGDQTTLGDAFAYMKNRVQEEVLRERGVLQTPVLKSKWEGKDLVISAPPLSPSPGLVTPENQSPTSAPTTATKPGKETILNP